MTISPHLRLGNDALSSQAKAAFCECGCGAQTSIASRTDSRKGHVAGEPLRFINGHNRRKKVAPPCGYVVDAATGCWLWQLTTDRGGYGTTRRHGRNVRVHRVFYEDANGPIPDGLPLDHLCSTPACVNPTHLEPVTPTENTRRGRATRLNAATVLEIRASNEPLKVLAERYGITPNYVYCVRTGRAWREMSA